MTAELRRTGEERSGEREVIHSPKRASAFHFIDPSSCSEYCIIRSFLASGTSGGSPLKRLVHDFLLVARSLGNGFQGNV